MPFQLRKGFIEMLYFPVARVGGGYRDLGTFTQKPFLENKTLNILNITLNSQVCS